MTQLMLFYIFFVALLIGVIFQHKAYKAKCKECETLWKVIRSGIVPKDIDSAGE